MGQGVELDAVSVPTSGCRCAPTQRHPTGGTNPVDACGGEQPCRLRGLYTPGRLDHALLADGGPHHVERLGGGAGLRETGGRFYKVRLGKYAERREGSRR